MISILIPIYNQSVLKLVRELSAQASNLDCSTEIICIDDGSEEQNKIPNHPLRSIPIVRYEELPENIGRSRIRNLLARKSQHPYLLFLDGDSEIINGDFLRKYFLNITKETTLVGGRVYPDICPSSAERLHWLTGRHREANESSAFQSNNFLIPAAIFKEIGFDENLSGYGHEDTLFGFELSQRKVPIHYIDNPTKHGGLENAETFLRNQSEAVVNLATIARLNPSLDTPLIRTTRRLHQFGIDGFVRQILAVLDPILHASLLSSRPMLFVLDLYKLGAFLRRMKEQEKTNNNFT